MMKPCLPKIHFLLPGSESAIPPGSLSLNVNIPDWSTQYCTTLFKQSAVSKIHPLKISSGHLLPPHHLCLPTSCLNHCNSLWPVPPLLLIGHHAHPCFTPSPQWSYSKACHSLVDLQGLPVADSMVFKGECTCPRTLERQYWNFLLELTYRSTEGPTSNTIKKRPHPKITSFKYELPSNII